MVVCFMALAVMNLLDFKFAALLYSLPDGATVLVTRSAPSLLESQQKRGQTSMYLEYSSRLLLSCKLALWTCHFCQAGQVLQGQEPFD
ncbi:hypothetical protein EDD36DRAFT_188228 [Exophiala viscosa]|uniref:Uncharacterized protein n=1 Tax=Exophiala viscosa TaxID=2486360 RepID=A0AAN6DZB2_9EURO|nr:hypothetical protein EDD36DRAFT_188228 [Exophiala viscosa]